MNVLYLWFQSAVYKSIDEEYRKIFNQLLLQSRMSVFISITGIDLQGIARAAVVGIARGGFSEGASTLTQQLIKNNVFPNFTKEKNFYDKLQRKIQEQYLAVQIEKQMSKNEIMESYLNTINLGQNCLGVQSASQRYFGKDVSDLTLSECAVIAGITQNPTDYDPVTRPENNKIRRNKVLKNMLEQGYISQKQYDKAMSDDVYARIQATSASSQADNAYSYFVDALAQQVIQDLKDQLGYTDTQAYNAVYSGGLSIYSTQNQEMQKICDEEANNDANYPGLKEYGLDYALTVTRADGSVENYGSNNIKNYVEKTYGKIRDFSTPVKMPQKQWWQNGNPRLPRRVIPMMNVLPLPLSHSLLSQSWIRRLDRSKQWSAAVEKKLPVLD